ncbi:MAG: GNAT family N-acetyltransferase [Proteobacteria bacterium]|nr:GNAT family N-acetyltransferase [Pseudomonadota bacterium]MBU1581951.1 GNAT family N-acetyltransferase [Pseudomonadota bacterium]MBU2453801.1 GNAT family N-acetyltransferase [Pseudomonadota bacterium]MBU2627365.1 GNAT family N-acetyltransferase [Pseudomonadota bacterium]
MEWEIKSFKELNTDGLYEILKLRVDVFVVEQRCPYPEIDDLDRHQKTLHLIGKNTDGKIVAYLRILPPGLSFKHVSMGRVVVAKKNRGHGISDAMLKVALDQISRIWPDEKIMIAAQVYLKEFYESHGFESASQSYLEDKIPHIDMIRKDSF